MSDPWRDLERAGEWLLRLESEFQPDVVHLNHLVHAELPWRAPVLSVGHSCVLSWWGAVHGTPAPAQWLTYRRRVSGSLRAARCVLAPTQAMLAELERYYGPFHEAAVIPNARNWRRFRAGHKEALVLAAGRIWDGGKNIEALSRVAARVGAPIVVAGSAGDPDGNVASICGKVRLLGPLDSADLASWYTRAAIYALPARYEPFGLTALEAAQSGCALVLGNIDSLREVWDGAARYVDPDDHDSLRDTLNELLANEPLRARLAASAMARARRFTPARQAAAYYSLYRRLCVGSHSDGGESHRAGMPCVTASRR
jgi:glycosyltransferase involved in cell wall biosynthesis